MTTVFCLFKVNVYEIQPDCYSPRSREDVMSFELIDVFLSSESWKGKYIKSTREEYSNCSQYSFYNGDLFIEEIITK